MRLNLGCGTDIKPGWVNVDFQQGPGVDVVWDLEGGELSVPFPPGEADEMLLSHVLEHLRYPLTAMQNLWDVAGPGCRLTVRVPYGSSDDAWEDPTHVRPYFLQSFGYFSQPYHWRSQGYGYRADWQPEAVTLMVDPGYVGQNKDAFLRRVMAERNLVLEMVAVLVKVDPPRPRERGLIRPPVYEIEACAR